MRKLLLFGVAIILASTCGCTPVGNLLTGDRPPRAAIAASPDSGTAPLSVYLNGSGSSDDRGIVSYSWDFDDGLTETTDAPSIEHLYQAPGIYEARLTVTDEAGQTDTASILITVLNSPPIVSFRMSSDAPLPGQTVSFDGSGSFDPDGEIVDFTWDFGDGVSGRGPQINHVYAAVGIYTVRLSLTDDSGASSSLTHTVDVHTGSSGGCTGGGGVCLGRFSP